MSVDGDAGRIVYFYHDASGRFHLLHGDKYHPGPPNLFSGRLNGPFKLQFSYNFLLLEDVK